MSMYAKVCMTHPQQCRPSKLDSERIFGTGSQLGIKLCEAHCTSYNSHSNNWTM